MPTPADIPARRLPAAAAAGPKRSRQRRGKCANLTCHITINRPRYACNGCWRQLPEQLQQRIKATMPRDRNELSDHDHPFRVAAREAKVIWGKTE